MTDLANLQVTVTDTGIDFTSAKLSQFTAEAIRSQAAAAGLQQQSSNTAAAVNSAGTATAQAAAQTAQAATSNAQAAASMGAVGTAARGAAAATGTVGAAATGAATGMNTAAMSALGLANGARTAGTAVNLTATQMTNLGYQLNDVISGIISGQSAFMILAQQGGQVFQALGQNPGGMAASLTAIRTGIAAVLTPMNVFGAGLGVIAVSAIASAIAVDNTNQAVERLGRGVAVGSGVTVDSFNRIANAAAGAGRMTVGTAQDIGIAMLSTGKATADSLGPAIRATENLARVMGGDLKGATAAVGGLMSDVGKNIDGLNQSFSFADGAQVQMIKNLQASGNATQAAAMAVNLLKKATDDATRGTFEYADVWKFVTQGVSGFLQMVGQGTTQGIVRLIGADEVYNLRQANETIEEARRKLNELNGNWSVGADMARSYWQRQLAGAEQTAAAMNKVIERTKAATDAAADLQKAQRTSVAATNLTNQSVGNTGAQAGANAALIEEALANDRAGKARVANYNDSAVAAQRWRAVERDVIQSGGNAEAQAMKSTLAYRAQSAAITAMTPQERAMAAALQSTADSFLQQLTPAERSTAAIRARMLVLERAAESERQAVESARATSAASIQSLQARTVGERAAAAAASSLASTINSGMSIEARQALARTAAAESRARDQIRERQNIQQMNRAHEVEMESITALTAMEKARVAGKQALLQFNAEEVASEEALTAQRIATTESLARSQQSTRQELIGMNREHAAAMQSIQAVTVAEQAAAAATQAYTQAINANKDAVIASTAAENARRQVLAQAEAQLKSSIRDQQGELTLIQLKINTIGMEASARARLIAGQQAANELASRGVDLNSALARSYINNAAAIGEATEKLREYEQAAQAAASVPSSTHSLGRTMDNMSGKQMSFDVSLSAAQRRGFEQEFGPGGYDTRLSGGGFGGSYSYSAVGVPNEQGLRYREEQRLSRDEARSGLEPLLDAMRDLNRDLTQTVNQTIRAPGAAPTMPRGGQPQVNQGEETPGGLSPFGRNANYFYDPSSRKTFAEQFNGFSDYVKAADARKHQQEMRQYEAAMKAYEAEVKQYEQAVQAQNVARQQLEQLRAVSAAMQNMRGDPSAIANAIRAALGPLLGTLQQREAADVDPFRRPGTPVPAGLSGLPATRHRSGVGPFTNMQSIDGMFGPMTPGGRSFSGVEFPRGGGGGFGDRDPYSISRELSSAAWRGLGSHHGGMGDMDTSRPFSSFAGGFNRGGGFTVGGRGGTDANRVVMDLTRGERVSVAKGSNRNQTINQTVNVNVNDNYELKKSSGTARREMSRMQRRMTR